MDDLLISPPAVGFFSLIILCLLILGYLLSRKAKSAETRLLTESLNGMVSSLQESEARFRRTVNSISDHIYMTKITAEGERINLYLSPNVAELTGYPREKLEADWHFWAARLIHPEDRSMTAAHSLNLGLGHGGEIEYRLVRADGQVIWVRDSARVEEQNGFRIVYGVVSDITERKQAEAELRQHRDHLEELVRHRTRNLTTLYEVVTMTNTYLELELMLDRVLDKTLAVIGSGVGLVHLLDEAGERLHLVAHRGLSEGAAKLAEMQCSQALWWDQVLRENRTVIVTDILDEPHLPDLSYFAPNLAYVGVPIHVEACVFGVLSLFEQSIDRLSADDIALVAAIADHLGGTVERARLTQRAEQAAVMEERQRLARELHDSVTQSLYSLTLFAAAVQDSFTANNSAQVEQYLQWLDETARQALREMRLLIYELRPLALDQEGLVGALRYRLETVERRAGLAAQLLVDTQAELPAGVQSGLYRIVQEALNNVLKHSLATQVTIYIASPDRGLQVEVSDNGCGFDEAALGACGGLGLANMRARAEKLGGLLQVVSRLGQGTRVTVTIGPDFLQNQRMER
jgi:PAS domain S-box-containing protein